MSEHDHSHIRLSYEHNVVCNLYMILPHFFFQDKVSLFALAVLKLSVDQASLELREICLSLPP